MKIGVLALQGAFAEHRKMLKKLGIESFEIRKKSDLSNAVDSRWRKYSYWKAAL